MLRKWWYKSYLCRIVPFTQAKADPNLAIFQKTTFFSYTHICSHADTNEICRTDLPQAKCRNPSKFGAFRQP